MNADIREPAKSLRPPFATSHYQWNDLHNLLDETNSRRLIVVSGPPSVGKSTLIYTYISTRNLPNIWYRVGCADKDVARFFQHFGVAVSGAMEQDNGSVADLRPAISQESTVFAKQYFQKIYQNLTPPFLIVLYDYQEVGEDAVLHDVICAACRELPKGGRMVIISRNECPRTLAQLCKSNSVAIIEPDDLLSSPV